MSGRKSAVPWTDWTEWQHVHAGLFSTDVYAQQHAVSRVAAWRSRVQLPVAIDATAQLVELQLHEHLARHHHHAVGASSRSHSELSLQYSGAVVRCVNGLVDGSQKGAYATAVSALAQRIGIPLWVVDLRHESTHNRLPSLPVLRFAARHLLAWLRANYWHTQEDAVRAQVHHAAHWLFAQLPYLAGDGAADQAQQNDVERMQEEGGGSLPLPPPILDADNLRNVVTPLLVFGEQYGEKVAPSGILFLDLGDAQSDGQEIPHKEALTAMLVELQRSWQSFSAWLLACLCRKVLDAVTPPTAAPDDEQEDATRAEAEKDALDQTQQQRELDVALGWIRLVVSNDWRAGLKFAAGPIDDIYQSGAEMLVHAEQLKAGDRLTQDKYVVVERLVANLRSCKSIRNHGVLATETSIRANLAKTSNLGWSVLSGWEACPIGLRHCYASHHEARHAQIREYSLDDDVLAAGSSTFVISEDEDEDPLKMDVDGQAEQAMDAIMMDLDADYDQQLQQKLELQATVARESIRHAGSADQEVLPQQELQRIQAEIEIW